MLPVNILDLLSLMFRGEGVFIFVHVQVSLTVWMRDGKRDDVVIFFGGLKQELVCQVSPIIHLH